MSMTVSKKDMDHVLSNLVCRGGHITIIMRELMEVYDDNVEYTIEEFLKPFVKKKFSGKLSFGLPQGEIKYSTYLSPLFYSAYVCKGLKNEKVITDVLYRVLIDHGYFNLDPDKCRETNDLFGDIGDETAYVQYWGAPRMSNDEKKITWDLYCDYLMAKQKGISRCPISTQ